MASAPRKPAAAAVGTKWGMTVTALATWIVASWMPVVNHQTVWKSVWNAVAFVFLHKYLSIVCVKTGEHFKLSCKGEERHMVRLSCSNPVFALLTHYFK